MTNADLRDALFGALEGLRTGKIDVATAKAMSDVSQTIINSAKLDIEYAKQSGRDLRNAFIEDGQPVQAVAAGQTGRRRIQERHPSSDGMGAARPAGCGSSLGAVN